MQLQAKFKNVLTWQNYKYMKCSIIKYSVNKNNYINYGNYN